MTTDAGGGICPRCKDHPGNVCDRHYFCAPNTTDRVDEVIDSRDAEIDRLKARVAELESEVREAQLRIETFKWTTEADQPIQEDDAIKAAFPTRSGRHDLFGEAIRMVGAKRSKYALVELVSWLLIEREALTRRAEQAEVKALNYREEREASRDAYQRAVEQQAAMVAAEREACALEAEAAYGPERGGGLGHKANLQIAAAIRARGGGR